MTLKFSDKTRDSIVKLTNFFDKYNFILLIAALVYIYIQIPEYRWVYPVAISGLILTLGVLVIICCPLLVLIAILTPILWISEKLHGKPIEKQE